MVSPSVRDDPSIGDSTDLWRRINPKWVVPDPLVGFRLTSQAFHNYDEREAVSVCVTCDAPSDYSPEDFARFEGYGVAAIRAGQVREERQGVVRIPEPGEVAHGHVIGKKSKGIQRRLAKAARLLIRPG